MSKKPGVSAGSRNNRNPQKEAQAALNFWQALEYLAPQSPPEVKLEASSAVWKFALDAPECELPWNNSRKREILKEQQRRNKHAKILQFQLFAGILAGDDFVETVRHYLGADDADDMSKSERPSASPVACVVLNVNSDGIASEDVFVSAVPWAIAQIVRGSEAESAISFRGFFGKEGLEKEIRSKIRDLMVERNLLADVSDPDQKSATPSATAEADVPSVRPAQPMKRPVTSDDVAAITSLVFTQCGWTPKQQEPWRVKANWVTEKGAGASRDDPLNSFYAEDLEQVADALKKGSVGPGLRAYLQGEDSADRIDLEEQVSHLIEGVHPAQQPPGCWPAKFPLVTAQQFAVNTLMHEFAKTNGMFSVNGPPGTGKTTMLKDIIAAIVVSRADVLVTFDNPESAFTNNLDIGQSHYAYELDQRLRNFGIVVSSANNGAVENITKELPGLPAIAPDLKMKVDYFSTVADSVAAPVGAEQRAAVLGNKGNRSTFASRFWWEGVSEKPKAGETSKAGENPDQPDQPDPLRLRSLRDIVNTGDDEAMKWDAAQDEYRKARKKVDDLMRLATRLAEAIQSSSQASKEKARAHAALVKHTAALDSGKEALNRAQTHQAEAQVAYERARQQTSVCRTWSEAHARMTQQRDKYAQWFAQVKPGALTEAKVAHARAAAAQASIRDDLESHGRIRPSFLSELFRTEFSRRWNAHGAQLESQFREARKKKASAADRVDQEKSIERELNRRLEAFQIAEAQASACWSNVVSAGVLDACDDVEPVDGRIDTREPAAILEQMDRIVERSRRNMQAAADATSEAQLALNATRRAIAAERARLAQAEADLAELETLLSDPSVPSESNLKNWDLAALDRDSMHRAAPYEFPALFEARRNLFIAAMNLHKAFVVKAWNRLSKTLGAFVDLLQGRLAPSQIKGGPVQLWNAFFLVVPVISTTFASFPRLFAGVGQEELAWLMIDEAGQAAPQQAVGAIWRSRRIVIVGDPLQLEPVGSVPQEMMGPLLKRCSAEQQWAPPIASAQTLADRANRYGMYLSGPDANDRIWLGSPLFVHRRCLEPMFSIANSIAYDNKMVYGAGDDKNPDGIEPSTWIHVPAEQPDGHWVKAQADLALQLVKDITGGVLRENGQFKVYVITPFRDVAQKMRDLLSDYDEQSRGMVGTVHTFQGKEAEHVIFLLGGDPKRSGVISGFAGAKPNLVNVAVTRAKRRLYVVGDRNFWTGKDDVRGIYKQMAKHLDKVQQNAEAGSDQEEADADAT